MDENAVVKTPNVFKNKNFTLTFLGALVSNIASLFYSFAVSFYILKITDNNAFLQGLYLAVGGITFCIVTLFGGVISDRFNKAKIMYICDYIKGAVIIAFTLLLMFVIRDNTGQVIALFVVAVLSNAIAGIFSPASSALLPQIVKEESFQQAQSYFSILNSFQSIVGVVLAGVLYTLIPINILFLIVGVCYIISAISEMFIKYKSEYENEDEKLSLKVVFGDIKEGFKYIISIKAVLSLMLAVLFINFFFSPIFENFVPYFIATDVANSNYIFKEIMAPEMWNSFGTMAFGIGSLVMSIILSVSKQKEKCNVTVRYSILGIAGVLIILTGSYALFINNIIGINALLAILIAVFLGIGLLVILVNVPVATVSMKIIDKDKFGKVTSVSAIGSQGLIPLSIFLGGLAITYVGSLGLLIACTAGFLLVALLLMFNKSVREI